MLITAVRQSGSVMCVCVCIYTLVHIYTHMCVYVYIYTLVPRWHSGKEPTVVKNPPVQSLGREDPLEEGMATHSRILAWRISWTEEFGGL